MAEKVYVTEADYNEIQFSANIDGLTPVQWLSANNVAELSIDTIQAAQNWDTVRRQRCTSVRLIEVPYKVWCLLHTIVIGGTPRLTPDGTIPIPTRPSVGMPIIDRPHRKQKPPETTRPSPKGSTIATWVERIACISFTPKRQMVSPQPSSLPPGNSMVIATDGFLAGENVVIDFHTTANISTVVADEFGMIQAVYVVPLTEAIGEKIVVAIGQTSNVYQQTIVEVISV